MKLAWFTPLDQRSAIGGCSKIIVDELARHCEVDLWVHGDGELIETDKRIVKFTSRSDALRELENYDHCIYNMGNYFPFHAEIYEVMKLHPGVVILHDFIMHHFFMVYYLHERRASDAYIGEMERSYGTVGREVALQSASGVGTPIWLTDDLTRFPLFERVVDYASGVFVHSHFHREQVQKKYIGDVGVAYLPCRVAATTRERAALFREFGIPSNKVVAISTGIVHPVKQIERVLNVIGANRKLAERLVYVIVGDAQDEYRAKLQSMAAAQGIAESVRFLGYQPADVLHDFVNAADFAINLRFPNSEGGSLSLIEQMSFGKPVVAIDSGMYREMPDSAVLKVASADRGQELTRALEALALNEPMRISMGKQAKTFAAANFTAETYVRRLLDFLSMQRSQSSELIHASLHEVAAAVSAAGYSIEKGAAGLEPLMREFYSLANGKKPQGRAHASFKTLGIWLGFEHATPLHREGMTRFLSYLARHLIGQHGIECEVWCYSFNESSVQESFKSLLSDSLTAGKIRIVHEKNWESIFISSLSAYDQQPEVSVEKNNLYELANSLSRADCFLLGICYLDNALALTRPVFIPLHDLVVLENYQAFVGENEGFRPYVKKTREAVELFNRRGAFFFCNSEHVRRGQLMKYIRHVDNKRTAVVYLPANVPLDIHRRILSEADTRLRYGIAKPYFFYPTQIRPHKNVLTLLRAFRQLIEEERHVQLVLTGSVEHVPAVLRYFKQYGLAEHVVFAKDVSEEALYALHAYASATVVPTLFEGGFPWQALEAMLMDTPAILSNIDAVSERLSAFSIDPSGLRRFDPYDVPALVEHMRDALIDRHAMVREQRAVKESLFRHQWQDVARSYFQVISDRLQEFVESSGVTGINSVPPPHA